MICAGYSHLSTGEVLVLQMETFRSYLLANTLASDREELFYLVLRGVDEGIMKVRRGWSKEKKHEQYMQVSRSSPLKVVRTSISERHSGDGSCHALHGHCPVP